ncbi:MAG: hypothetical protein DLM54_06380 [Acidimicrobiales bacterium]|nr:MAG: hypothetical protein DLM54_06380 [Acidimicrobiales bacterium]
MTDWSSNAARPGAPAGKAESPSANRSRLASLAPIVVFDVAGPLVVYYALQGAGLSTVTALILSGLPPAFGIALTVVRHRRLDAIGTLVLIGIVVGTALGLVSGSPHLVLIDGVVPTVVFGAVCLGSLWSRRPLMFRFALEFMGADTPKGRDFADKWRYAGFRHAFRVTTVVWGLAFLAEAAAQVAIIETRSAGTAKTTANVLPLIVAAMVIAWNVSYAKRGQRKGELAAEAARARGEAPPPMPA